MKIYGDTKSGNCYKVRLVCGLLGIEPEWIDVDILAGDTQSEEFLNKNPNGKIPLLELDHGETLAESNAIINYLAGGTDLYPGGGLAQARVQQWQFFEQYSHEPFIAVARFLSASSSIKGLDIRKPDSSGKDCRLHKKKRPLLGARPLRKGSWRGP